MLRQSLRLSSAPMPLTTSNRFRHLVLYTNSGLLDSPTVCPSSKRRFYERRGASAYPGHHFLQPLTLVSTEPFIRPATRNLPLREITGLSALIRHVAPHACTCVRTGCKFGTLILRKPVEATRIDGARFFCENLWRRRVSTALAVQWTRGTLLLWSDSLHGSQRRLFRRLHTGGRFTSEQSHGTSPSHQKYFIVVITLTAQSSTHQPLLPAQGACPVQFETNSAFGQIHVRTFFFT